MILRAFKAAAALIFLVSALSSAQAQVLGFRHPVPSPDGSRICFSYQGDLWIVSSQGGKAERLTAHVGYEGFPAWSSDDLRIAFSSDRNGNFDVFVVPTTGGPEKQLTWHSSDDFVSGWSQDNRRVLFHSQRDLAYEQVWDVSAAGGRERPLTSIESSYGAVTSDGEKLIFTHGAIPWWRKGYRGAGSCDSYSKNLKTGEIERLTFSNSNELQGMLAPSSAELIYLSDSTGSYNLFRRNIVGGSVVQITNHRLDVSHPSLSADGSLLAYELGGEIFLYDLRVGQGRKLMVEVQAGPKTNDMQYVVTDSGISEFSIAPDGTAIVYANGGEIFCRSLLDESQRKITNSIATESAVAFTHDSRQISFIGELEGSIAIYLVSSNDGTDPNLCTTQDFYTTNPIKTDQSLRLAKVAPDQKRIAFVRGENQLIVSDIKKATERTIADKNPIGDCSWSPDGRYVVFTQQNANWDNDLYIGDSESGSVEKISSVPGQYHDVGFSSDGRLIHYINEGDVYYLFLDRQLAEMSPSSRRDFLDATSQQFSNDLVPVTIDFETIESRPVRLTNLGSVTDLTYSAELANFVFATSNDEILAMGLDDVRPRLVSTSLNGPNQIQFISSTSNLLLLDNTGRLYSIDLNTTEVRRYPFKSEVGLSQRDMFRQVYSEILREIRWRFYDDEFHGVNWNSLREQFTPRVEAVREKVDFRDLMLELLGQFNASHLNLWCERGRFRETGQLGIILDYEDNSSGFKVLETLPGSPAANMKSEIKPLDKITDVNGRKLENDADIHELLNGTIGNEIRVDLINRGGITRYVSLAPVSIRKQRELLALAREQEARTEVDRLSKGRVAYVQLNQITTESVNRLEMALKTISTGRDALLIDLRGNTGGAEHDGVLRLLSRKAYISHKHRSGEEGSDSPWAFAGPMALLVDERTSSDAEIVALGFRELGLGEIIGTTTLGAVIGTEKAVLSDGSVLHIPTVGWYSLSNQNLENNGLSPDVAVPVDLNRADRGEDNQLIEAVNRLLSKLK